MKGHKRYRAGAWRLVVAAGADPETGRRRNIYESVKAPNNRAGAKEADARLAELIVAVESGRLEPSENGVQRELTVAELAGIRLHDLRHTAASQTLMAGVPISVVAERLGCTEANILTTYRHFVPGADQQAAELMDRLLAADGDVQVA